MAGEGSFTLFAPTNEAFSDALAALGIRANDLLGDSELLTSVLTYHAAGEVITSADILDAGSGELEMLSGDILTYEVTNNGVILNETAAVSEADVMASNGVLHVIDAVLLAPEERRRSC